MDATRVPWKQPLIGGVDPSSEHPPLAAVGVSRHGEINGIGTEVAVKVFGMVTKKQLIPRCGHEGVQHGQVGHPVGIQQSRAQRTDGKAVPFYMPLVDQGRPRGINDLSPYGGERKAERRC